jgi:hypothetical protein
MILCIASTLSLKRRFGSGGGEGRRSDEQLDERRAYPASPEPLWQHHGRQVPTIGKHSVTAPILRVPDEGTLGAEKHLEAHLDKLLEGGGVKVTHLVGFKLLSHPLSHLGV